MVAKAKILTVCTLLLMCGTKAFCEPEVLQTGVNKSFVSSRLTWEYAHLLISGFANIYTWTTPTQSFYSNKFPDLLTQLGQTFESDKITVLNVLNVVGKDGWELVSVYDLKDKDQQFLFKRLKQE